MPGSRHGPSAGRTPENQWLRQALSNMYVLLSAVMAGADPFKATVAILRGRVTEHESS